VASSRCATPPPAQVTGRWPNVADWAPNCAPHNPVFRFDLHGPHRFMATQLDLQEQEQLDALKAFWKQYGNLITWT
jgi:hypothetical protein